MAPIHIIETDNNIKIYRISYVYIPVGFGYVIIPLSIVYDFLPYFKVQRSLDGFLWDRVAQYNKRLLLGVWKIAV